MSSSSLIEIVVSQVTRLPVKRMKIGVAANSVPKLLF